MSLAESKGGLARATKDLLLRWQEVKDVWSDSQSRHLEQTYLVPLEQDVRSALQALEHMNQVLEKLKDDCE